jgi:hypothetical protein
VVRECSRRQIKLDIAIHSIKDGDYCFFSKSEKRQLVFSPEDDALGYLIQTPGCELPAILVEHAMRMKKPLAVLDETGTGQPPFGGKRPVPIVTFQTGFDTGTGEMIGNFLLQLGHRHIAYISPFHGSDWSVNRYNGLCKSFAAAGCPQGVSRFTIDNFAYSIQYELEMLKPGNLDALLAHCDKVESCFPSRADFTSEKLRETVTARLASDEIRSRMIPMFERALSDRSITAWVGGNDFVAITALHFLKVTKRIAVPESISVVGFDNTLDAFINDCTSYDFNIPAAVRAMIDFIIEPKGVSQLEPASVQHIDGILVQRGSTGRARL